MTASNDRKRAAVMRLVRKGLLTPDEAAGLTSTPRDLVEHWARCEGIDIATTRAIYLLKVWCSELADEHQDNGHARRGTLSRRGFTGLERARSPKGGAWGSSYPLGESGG
jgi:hypothetical protein